uniref:Atg4b n=1 Tax=Arundo donax TaxID=35708 RepID=A0A0A9F093_ARUDO
MARKIYLWLFMWFRVMKMVKGVELQLFALMLLLSFAVISTKDSQHGHLFFC